MAVDLRAFDLEPPTFRSLTRAQALLAAVHDTRYRMAACLRNHAVSTQVVPVRLKAARGMRGRCGAGAGQFVPDGAAPGRDIPARWGSSRTLSAWRRTLLARTGQQRGLTAGYEAAVDAAADQTLPGLRDALLGQATIHEIAWSATGPVPDSTHVGQLIEIRVATASMSIQPFSASGQGSVKVRYVVPPPELSLQFSEAVTFPEPYTISGVTKDCLFGIASVQYAIDDGGFTAVDNQPTGEWSQWTKTLTLQPVSYQLKPQGMTIFESAGKVWTDCADDYRLARSGKSIDQPTLLQHVVGDQADRKEFAGNVGFFSPVAKPYPAEHSPPTGFY